MHKWLYFCPPFVFVDPLSLNMKDGQRIQGRRRFGFPLKFGGSRTSGTDTSFAPVGQNAQLSCSPTGHASIQNQESGSDERGSTFVVSGGFFPHNSVERTAFGDQGRTRLRYEASLKTFEKALESRRGKWKLFDLPKFDIVGGDPIPHLREQIDNTLCGMHHSEGDEDLWSRGKLILEKVFVSLIPLTKSLLHVAKTASSVRALQIQPPLYC